MEPRIEVTLPDWIQTALPRQGVVYETDQDKMSLVIDLLDRQIRESTGGPFAAAIFDSEHRLVAVGVNRVVPLRNSVLHAEMVAIQFAEGVVQTFNLAEQGDFTLVTSAQPCAMCFGAIPWAGVRRVVIGATAQDTEQLTGFDEGPIHPEWRTEYAKRGIVVTEGVMRTEACRLLKLYRELGGTIYNGGRGAEEAAETGQRGD